MEKEKEKRPVFIEPKKWDAQKALILYQGYQEAKENRKGEKG